MFDFELKGLKEVEKKLNDLQKRATAIDGTNKVPLNELLDSLFLRKYSSFNSLEEMLDKSPFEIKNQDDFRKIDDKDWDEFINNNTKFNSWEEMLSAATKIWVAKKLDLG